MSKRRELIDRRRELERRQTMIVLVLIGALAIIVIGGAVILNNNANANANNTSAQLGVVASTQSVPPNAEANGRAWGPKDAPIKVEEYLDYQCPACGAYNRSYEAGVIDAFAKTGKVRYEIHSISFIGQESLDAAAAALCATDQNKFWQMHDALFANQNGENQNAFNKTRLKDIAAKAGLDTATFNTCVDSGKYASQVTQERTDSETRGVQQTPTFFVNGKMYPGTLGAADFKKIFDQIAPDVKLQ
jgi:protein-disulfide isomerase